MILIKHIVPYRSVLFLMALILPTISVSCQNMTNKGSSVADYGGSVSADNGLMIQQDGRMKVLYHGKERVVDTFNWLIQTGYQREYALNDKTIAQLDINYLRIIQYNANKALEEESFSNGQYDMHPVFYGDEVISSFQYRNHKDDYWQGALLYYHPVTKHADTVIIENWLSADTTRRCVIQSFSLHHNRLYVLINFEKVADHSHYPDWYLLEYYLPASRSKPKRILPIATNYLNDRVLLHKPESQIPDSSKLSPKVLRYIPHTIRQQPSVGGEPDKLVANDKHVVLQWTTQTITYIGESVGSRSTRSVQFIVLDSKTLEPQLMLDALAEGEGDIALSGDQLYYYCRDTGYDGRGGYSGIISINLTKKQPVDTSIVSILSYKPAFIKNAPLLRWHQIKKRMLVHIPEYDYGSQQLSIYGNQLYYISKGAFKAVRLQ